MQLNYMYLLKGSNKMIDKIKNKFKNIDFKDKRVERRSLWLLGLILLIVFTISSNRASNKTTTSAEITTLETTTLEIINDK